MGHFVTTCDFLPKKDLDQSVTATLQPKTVRRPCWSRSYGAVRDDSGRLLLSLFARRVIEAAFGCSQMLFFRRFLICRLTPGLSFRGSPRDDVPQPVTDCHELK